MAADDHEHAPLHDSPQAWTDAPAPRAPRVLCYVNHFYGASAGFSGKSTSQAPEARRAIVERCLASVRAAIPQAEIRLCGVPGRSLLPIDLPFAGLEDPRQLVYASLNRMADEVDGYDWFLNLEDDIELPARAWHNAQQFERDSLPNECLLPNRLELRDGEAHCVDLEAIPGWTTQERTFQGRTFRVALNPHSALLLLSKAQLRYALRHVDRSYRGPVIGGLMASAYAHFHKPLALYRCFDDPAFHAVVHLDHWAGPAPEGSALRFSAVLLSWKRAHNLPLLVRELRQIPQIGEVLVWNNNPAQRLDLPGATVIEAPRNFTCLPRYCLVPLARFDHIWFQDDDLLIRPRQFAALLAAYAKDPSRIYGCRGRNLREGKYVFADAYGEVDIVLGQTMMFHRRLLREAFAALGELPPPTMDDDIAFSLSCRRRHLAVNVEPIEDLGMSDGAALHLQPQHGAKRQAAVDRYRAWAAAQRPPQESPPAQLAALQAENALLKDAQERLVNSATFRAAGALKRLPLLYPAYLRAARLLRARPG